jgi:hypothetical protein
MRGFAADWNSIVRKIALYGFGSQPIVHRHLIDLAANEKLPLEWCAILPTPHYRSVIGEVLPSDQILDVFRLLPRQPIGGDLSCLSHYPGSLVEDLAAQKRSFRRRSGKWLLGRGIDYYRIYKEFLTKCGATHILTSSLETPDSKIIVAAAQELCLGVIAPVDMRNMTGTYFSIDCYETPPAYGIANPKTRAQAIEFINRFRSTPAPARALPDEITSGKDDITLSLYLPSLWQRSARFARSAIERPDMFDPELMRIAIMAYAAPLRKLVRGTRAWRNLPEYDIADVEGLPKQFLFYPLQYTPESSINTPAPYYVDQMRAIDGLRFAMPSDHVLVVKEHPACVEMRRVEFIQRLRRTPGVAIIRSSVRSIEIIERAALTVTITGTAAFEAFILGRPAMALGPGLSAWALGKITPRADLRTEILQVMNEPVSTDFQVDQIAKLMSVRYPFLFNPPHLPGEPMLRRANMRSFLHALIDHLNREAGNSLRNTPPLTAKECLAH